MPYQSWFEADPDRLQRELNALAACGVDATVDATARDQGILRLSFSIDGTNPCFGLAGLVDSVELVATFPDNYPYFRPEVAATNLTLPRHQHPLGSNLCLLPRPADNWAPQWQLATYLQEQLAKVLRKGNITDPALLAADPDEQAEPASEYFHARNLVVFDDTGLPAVDPILPAVAVLGKMLIGLPKKAGVASRLAVLETTDTAGRTHRLPQALWEQFPLHFISGHLLHLSQAPPYTDSQSVLRWLLDLAAQHGIVSSFAGKPLPLSDGTTLKRVIGFRFPEEVAPGQMGTGWLFLLEMSFKQMVPHGPKGKLVPQDMRYINFGKAARTTPADLQLRIPALKALSQHTIAVVGLGALGAPTALELARNQVGELRVMDFDHAEPGPSVRWPLGLAAAGLLKTDAIRDFLALQYPATRVVPVNHKIGALRNENEPSEQEIMDTFLDGVALLIDASADKGISHFLARTAQARRIPFISLYATPGAWGGLIMRVVPGQTAGCWMCAQYHLFDGSIPVPLADESTGSTQAAGCGDLTFTGASFDLQNVALAGVRLAVSTLSAGGPEDYPLTSWDVGVVQLMTPERQLLPPTWHTFSLEAHPSCPYCSP
ncbi:MULTISPECIES: ThiF family adenylyltransferase [Hymenobacter]|uniref:E2 family protein B n=1 Tax=Hymenobacter psychrotolerans DSM 18569 TaxID=1121959 RepID=A0A1M7A1T8_9BACT|nr:MULTISPECIES: ThiF family adenylyltransferase [Hymenobacter]QNE42067.1 hypothetical protein F1C16_20785 [Hymenobacter sp. NBH84]SHL36569.1 E2 family protein B [Hymenobacter psychrotolerans DSM 18569]